MCLGKLDQTTILIHLSETEVLKLNCTDLNLTAHCFLE